MSKDAAVKTSPEALIETTRLLLLGSLNQPLTTAELLERLALAGQPAPARTHSGQVRQLRRILQTAPARQAGIRMEEGRFPTGADGRPAVRRWYLKK